MRGMQSMDETIFWWIFLSACVLAFFFSYGMVENMLQIVGECRFVKLMGTYGLGD